MSQSSSLILGYHVARLTISVSLRSIAYFTYVSIDSGHPKIPETYMYNKVAFVLLKHTNMSHTHATTTHMHTHAHTTQCTHPHTQRTHTICIHTHLEGTEVVALADTAVTIKFEASPNTSKCQKT